MSFENKNYDPMRMTVLRSLPQEVKESLTQEEVDAFLRGDELPESLEEKLKEYLEDL